MVSDQKQQAIDYLEEVAERNGFEGLRIALDGLSDAEKALLNDDDYEFLAGKCKEYEE